MNKIAIIIPSRLDALRLPNKPLKLINNKEMILHVYEAAKKTNASEVYVATPDQKIIDLVKREIEINKEHHYSTITDGTADLSQGRLEFAESILEIIKNLEE